MTIDHVKLEADALTSDARSAVHAAYDLGRELEQLGRFVCAALEPQSDIESFEGLEEKQVRLSGLGAQASALTARLMCLAGELKALASVRRGVES